MIDRIPTASLRLRHDLSELAAVMDERGREYASRVCRQAIAYIEELEKDRDSWRGAAYSWKKIADPINEKNIEAMFARTQNPSKGVEE